MGIADKKQAISKAVPGKTPLPPPKTRFQEKKYWYRDDLREGLGKESPIIPDTGGAMYGKHQRKKIFEEDFPRSRYGSHLTELEVKRGLRNLRKKRHQAPTGVQKREIKRRIGYWKRFFQIKNF